MINAFQTNTTIATAGIAPTGNTRAAGSAGESQFSMLLNSLNGGQGTDTQSSDASFYTQASLADMISSGDSASSGLDSTVSLDSKASGSNHASINSSDFLLPESAMPNLMSFLEKKGFSTEQIDSILLSSLNEDGQIQIHKLVAAIHSARTGTLSDETGLGIDAAYVPNVQELLFNMGMGVGEVTEIIEKSKDDTGGISLDKLTNALNEQLLGSLTRAEMVSLLEQNNISVTSQADGIAAVSADPGNNISLNAQASDNAAGMSGREKGIANDQSFSNMPAAWSGQKNNISLNSDISSADLTATGLQKDIGDDSQAFDINKAAVELKKEFTNFVDGNTKGSGETESQKTAAQSGEKVVQAQVTKSRNETLDAENAVSNPAKAVTRESTQETSPLNQALSQGQKQWQKGDQAKIIDILKGENQVNARVDGKEIIREQNETTKDPGGFLKQGDQKASQDILSGVNENKAVSGTLTAETADFKDSLLNVRETQTIDLTSQNMSKVSEDVANKTQTKGVYNLPEPLPRVFDRMVIMIKNGEQTGKLMIQPPELGKIDIDLTIKSGHIQANLTTENIAVKEIIEANLNQLKQQLNDQGLVVEQFNVSVGSHNRQFREDFGQEGNNGYGSSRSGESGSEEIAAAADEGTSADMINSRYRIDVHV